MRRVQPTGSALAEETLDGVSDDSGDPNREKRVDWDQNERNGTLRVRGKIQTCMVPCQIGKAGANREQPCPWRPEHKAQSEKSRNGNRLKPGQKKDPVEPRAIRVLSKPRNPQWQARKKRQWKAHHNNEKTEKIHGVTSGMQHR